jgi:protein gp37
MGESTGIAWANHTFNPWHGCVEVSPGCDHCYARRFDARFFGGKDQDPAHWGKESPRRFFGDKHWNEPLKWNRAAEKDGQRHLVFCASMADWAEIGRDDIDPHRKRLFELIERTRYLTWLMLTKRPQNIRKVVPLYLFGLPNVWYGTTIESPAYLWRADALCDASAAMQAPVRFVSMEPYLEPTPDIGIELGNEGGINWVITGSESGDGARHTPTAWFRELRDIAHARNVPFLFKQADQGAEGITEGDGSFIKRDLRMGNDGMRRSHYIVEKPYLDGVQHHNFPMAA